MAASFHAYEYQKGTQNFLNIQAAGIGFICTEMGDITTASTGPGAGVGPTASYSTYRNNGWAYTFWQGWNNYGGGSNAYNSSMSTTAPWTGNQQIAPTATN
jgi:hypothetical protein